jgi:hypothetical protein
MRPTVGKSFRGSWSEFHGAGGGSGNIHSHPLRRELQRPPAGVRRDVLELGQLDRGYRSESVRAATVWIVDYRDGARRQHRSHAARFLSGLLAQHDRPERSGQRGRVWRAGAYVSGVSLMVAGVLLVCAYLVRLAEAVWWSFR